MAERDAIDGVVLSALGGALGIILARLDITGRDHVHRHMLWREISGERPRQALQAGLGGDHMRMVSRAREGTVAADIDDAPNPAAHEMRRRRLGTEECAIERDAEHLAPFCKRDIAERAAAAD